jgi:hypothetical protein
MADTDLTAERLREFLHYNPENGVFTWRETRCSRAIVGASAGGTHSVSGYWRICIEKRLYRAHRLVWLYVHGAFPLGDIDHINGVRDDNRICNLRQVTRQTNTQNLRTNKGATSRFLGVSWEAYTGRWKAQIKGPDGKHRNLGRFDVEEDAYQAYLDAKRKLHQGCTI